ncbi:PDDEXK nuclease domain-containing protein [Caedibacter taeniospiralis]|uniref:PDDEXK nuclease domain-containing protein n=1 Tax=Caedibacter taeniospiralis TaxID=28907 RepID=UPI000C27C05E|nr:PDDEXK nuclease domain-containing protein [Caedibacter taeniospiralis]
MSNKLKNSTLNTSNATLIKDTDYASWLKGLKVKIRSVQVSAALAANSVLIDFYFDLGRMISEKDSVWGSKFLEQLAKDLRREFPDIQGFSITNLKYCRLFFKYISIRPQTEDELNLGLGVGEQTYPLIRRLPWGHIKMLISKVKSDKEILFYINQTIENGWSRDTLALQIKSNLYVRQGKAINNFQQTLPEPQSDLARQTMKDPYTFDFLTMTKPYNERDIEKQLVDHITKFLLELGKGFAFVGRQYHLEVGESDYYLDLLFYHVKLKCYVVIELKNTKFIPEYAGKLNFYLSAVDSLLKSDTDNPTIGILVCRDKNTIETEFALRDINKPMGVSEFTLTEILPDELKGSLPTVEEIEADMEKLEEQL